MVNGKLKKCSDSVYTDILGEPELREYAEEMTPFHVYLAIKNNEKAFREQQVDDEDDDSVSNSSMEVEEDVGEQPAIQQPLPLAAIRPQVLVRVIIKM